MQARGLGRLLLHLQLMVRTSTAKVLNPVRVDFKPAVAREMCLRNYQNAWIYISFYWVLLGSSVGRGLRGERELALRLDGVPSGVLASGPSANSHRERWRELAP